VVRDTICDIGYNDGRMGFDGFACAGLLALDKQSPDIAQGANEGTRLDLDQGAGDRPGPDVRLRDQRDRQSHLLAECCGPLSE
jgi:hypothetical protein